MYITSQEKPSAIVELELENPVLQLERRCGVGKLLEKLPQRRRMQLVGEYTYLVVLDRVPVIRIMKQRREI